MKLLQTFNVFWSLILIVLVILSIKYTFIGIDAPYYLSISRDIANGNIPYSEINNIYAPVMMYLNSLIYLTIENPTYNIFLIFQYSIIILSVGFMFLLSQKLGLDIQKSIYISIFLFIAVLGSEGNYINLEVYILLWVLLSLYFLIKKQFFLVGFFLGISLFTKQYGILNLFPFLLLVIFYHGYKRIYLVKYFLGISVPVIIFLVYFLIIKDTSPLSLFDQLSGRGYAQEGFSQPRSLITWLIGSQTFLLLTVTLFFLKLHQFNDKLNFILLVGILSNLIPVFIKVFPHYFILTYPYVFFLIARNLKSDNRKFFNSSNMVLMAISLVLFMRIIRYKDVYQIQLQMAEKYRTEYPIGSHVFLSGGIRYLYILNNYQNPVLSSIGYDYGFIPDKKFKDTYPVIEDDFNSKN